MLCHFWNTIAEYFWDIGSKIGSFVKYLLWQQHYFGTDYPPPSIFRSTSPHYALPVPSLALPVNVFSTPPPLFSILKSSYPPFVTGGWVQTMLMTEVYTLQAYTLKAKKLLKINKNTCWEFSFIKCVTWQNSELHCMNRHQQSDVFHELSS